MQKQRDRLEQLFEGLYQWLGRLYVPDQHGFVYQLSSLENPERFSPDLESTAQALIILHRSGLTEHLPDETRLGVAEFFNRHQHPDGYFRAPGGPDHNTDRMLGRYLSYATGVLDSLGVEPRYPLPRQLRGEGQDRLPLDENALRAWVDQRSWDNPWRAIDEISARAQIISVLPEPARTDAGNILLDCLDAMQNPGDGLWGGGEPYVRVSGGFKASLVYRNRRPMPRPERIYDTTMNCLRQQRANRVTWVSNLLNLILSVRPHLDHKIPARDREDLVRISIDNLSTCRREDGGFSIESKGSWPAPNDGIVLGHGRVEGDMNSAALALQVWFNLLDLMGLEPRPPASAEGFRAAMPERLTAR
ncbi:prenyltransferase/squalene oxidase repeat-containing protein [Mucisphaera calidilacus]|uniref:Uncharacterized protein n=1 Tax=Mucisphaera calidilacus TaxID=2527982 RepID=A0A518BWW5_9BACT|nr:hypothetical protein [Mucisphaera calidilacus]QDU71470.1 hypothetical protein Pan265_13200 [Mucisphaera calidilacus]